MLDPVIAPSAYSTSTSFQLFGSFGEPAIGTSTATTFQANAGFLTFPFASTPGRLGDRRRYTGRAHVDGVERLFRVDAVEL